MRQPPPPLTRPVVGRVAAFIIVSVVSLGLETLPPGSSSVTGPVFASAGTTTSTREDSAFSARTLRPPANWTFRTLRRRRPRTRMVLPPLTGTDLALALAVEALPLGQALAQVTRMIMGAARYVLPPVPAEADSGSAQAATSAASAKTYAYDFTVLDWTFATWVPLASSLRG